MESRPDVRGVQSLNLKKIQKEKTVRITKPYLQPHHNDVWKWKTRFFLSNLISAKGSKMISNTLREQFGENVTFYYQLGAGYETR